MNTDINLPPNVQLIEADITRGLPPRDGGYDIINARLVTGYPSSERRTKPSNLVLYCSVYRRPLNDPFFEQVLDDGNQLLPLVPNTVLPDLMGGSWWAGWLDIFFKVIYNYYQTVEALIKNHGGFSLFHRERYLVPTNGTEKNGRKGEEELGRISNNICLVCGDVSQCLYPTLTTSVISQGFCRAVAKVFGSSGGFSTMQVDEWITSIEQEFESSHFYQTYNVACGLKSK
ncbi:hypothetical protein B0H11DRAFT_2193602 [Mycena galericulata]|nr:hypothetical protein B0H11DRAFT_2193602 [Mycena galericulata]